MPSLPMRDPSHCAFHSHEKVHSPLYIAVRILVANRNGQIIRRPVVAAGNGKFAYETFWEPGFGGSDHIENLWIVASEDRIEHS